MTVLPFRHYFLQKFLSHTALNTLIALSFLQCQFFRHFLMLIISSQLQVDTLLLATWSQEEVKAQGTLGSNLKTELTSNADVTFLKWSGKYSTQTCIPNCLFHFNSQEHRGHQSSGARAPEFWCPPHFFAGFSWWCSQIYAGSVPIKPGNVRNI